MTMKLFVDKMSQPSRAVLTLCAEFRVPHEVVSVRIDKGETRKPSFRAINPFGKVPFMQDGDVSLAESHTIMRYICQKYSAHIPESIYPRDDLALRCRIDEKLDAHHNLLRKGAAGYFFWSFLVHRINSTSDAEEKKRREVLAQDAERILHISLGHMEDFLDKAPFLAGGKRLSLADISAFEELIQLRLIKYDISKYANVVSWTKRMQNGLQSYQQIHDIFEKAVVALNKGPFRFDSKL